MERGTAIAVILSYVVLALLGFSDEYIDGLIREIVRAEMTP